MGEVAEKTCEPTLAQAGALRHVRKRCLEIGAPPSGVSPWDASSELRATPCYTFEDVGAAVPLDASLLSLPPEGSSPTPLAQLLGEDGPRCVMDFESRKLRSKDVAGQKKIEEGFRG